MGQSETASAVECPQAVADLVSGFATHIKALKSAETKEATVRQNYIDPFWRALGWDVGDTGQRGPAEAEVIVEKNVETAESTGLHNRAVDYLFRLNGFPRFVVEAKKPALDIDTDQDAIFQAKRYAWNKTIPFAVLTDFEQFRLYDCTLKPIHNDPGRGLIKDFSLDYGSYVQQWDVLHATFGREAVADGSLERLLAQVKKVKTGRRIRTVDRMLIDLKGSEPVDQVFLAYLDAHRKHFAAELYRHNRKSFPEADTLHGAAKLTEAVQRIMDRLVFLRVCEDRDIIRFGSLRETLRRIGAEGGDLYEVLTKDFRSLDDKYNGYLFKPHFSEELKIEGSVLADFIRTLYPPDGPWDFAAVGDDILGIVYERFLGNVVTVKQHQVTIEEKPEVRHAGGVYYTPRFVVDTIIRRVVGPKIEGKTPAQVLDVKILDPACGSGSFLVAALQFLFDNCLKAVQADPALAKMALPGKGRKKKADVAFQDGQGVWHLAPDFRSSLLTNCIHGVDIDQQAVEVTVMSLYLKMLESKLPENWATLWVERQLLPSLENNVMCGNSLISEVDWFAYAEKTKATLFSEDKDLAFRINRFDWESRTRGFGRLLDKQATKERGRNGFDCIIGNPPYIRVQELNKWAPEECEFYKWKYASAAKGNYDIYVVFAEKALMLLAPDGLVGFIMPNKWWQAQYGEGLRKLVAEGRNISSLIDFTDQQVFTGATTYTAIHILQHRPHKGAVDVAVVTDLQDGQTQCTAIDSQVHAPGSEFVRFGANAPRGGEPWTFQSIDDETWCKRVAADCPRLIDIAPDIFVGLQTSADTVFVFEDFKTGKRTTEVHSVELDKPVELESDLLRPVVRSGEIGRHWANATARVLFPYTVSDGRAKIVSPKDMENGYPLAWAYLKANEKMLRGRESGKFDHEEWYGLMRKNLEHFKKYRSICR